MKFTQLNRLSRQLISGANFINRLNQPANQLGNLFLTD